jgi:hypothetical protein
VPPPPALAAKGVVAKRAAKRAAAKRAAPTLGHPEGVQGPGQAAVAVPCPRRATAALALILVVLCPRRALVALAVVVVVVIMHCYILSFDISLLR